MPSIRYKLIETMFGAIGVNKMLDKQGADFEKLLKDYSAKQKKPLKIPYKKLEKQFDVMKKDIAGTNCYVIRLRSQAPKTAVLYLFGSGYILPPDPGDLILCGQIAANCNAEVWFPALSHGAGAPAGGDAAEHSADLRGDTEKPQCGGYPFLRNVFRRRSGH